MRQTLKAAGMATLLLLSVSDLTAEPLVKGFFVEKLPSISQSQALAPGKGLVLAHVLNQGEEAISKGDYQIGVEIEDKGSVKTYSLSPKDSIVAGAIKTFRMAVPVEGIDKTTGQFRVFSRINGITTWSEKYSFLQGMQSSSDKTGVTTLYTEAPAVNENKVARKEVPFETEGSTNKPAMAKAADSKKVNDSVSVKKAENSEKSSKTAVAKAEKPETAKIEKKVEKVSTAAKTEVAAAKPSVSKSKTPAEALKQLEDKKAAEATKVAAKAKAKAEEKAKVAVVEAKSQVTRKINPSEFKKLKTMDEELIIYVVKDGDTLRSISENYYGNASKERTIADLNFIEKSSAVRVGEEIIVEVRPLQKTKG